MISQTVLATIAKFVAVGGLMAAGGGGVYFVVTRTSDDPSRQVVTAETSTSTPTATDTPNDAATATPPATTTPAAGSIFASDLKRLTPDLVSPAFSPDGSKILGGDKNGLEVGAADGSDLRAIEPDFTSAVWSPDSRMLAVTLAGSGRSDEPSSGTLIVMDTDGSSRTELGKTDFPLWVQYLANGRLAYVRDQRLHFADTTTGTDATVDGVAPIVNDNLTPSRPFLVSGDGQFVATMRGTTLSVQNLVSAENRKLTDAIDARWFSGYGWSPDGVLAYSDVNPAGDPALHLFDTRTGTERVLLQGTANGVFSGVSWSTPKWLVFVFYPHGTVAEELAEYQAIDVSTGASTLLLRTGLGLNLSGGGRKLIFSRSDMKAGTVDDWVATLGFQ